jgi:hypothetical protein
METTIGNLTSASWYSQCRIHTSSSIHKRFVQRYFKEEIKDEIQRGNSQHRFGYRGAHHQCHLRTSYSMLPYFAYWSKPSSILLVMSVQSLSAGSCWWLPEPCYFLGPQSWTLNASLATGATHVQQNRWPWIGLEVDSILSALARDLPGIQLGFGLSKIGSSLSYPSIEAAFVSAIPPHTLHSWLGLISLSISQLS